VTAPLGAPRLEAPFFNYFDYDYRWSSGLLLALGSAAFGGADVGEIHAVGRQLSSRVGDDVAWFDAWRAAGSRAHDAARSHLAAGHSLTAAATAVRACTYYQVGERFAVKDNAAAEAFAASLEAFATFVQHTDRPTIERQEVPYEKGNSLPAYFVHPSPGTSAGPAPCVVFFDGLDITKELQYLRGVEELSRRGIACLIVDGPGNGESIRLRGLPLRHDCEVAGTAAYEHVASRPDVHPDRVAVMGISLGGYFATRCAALEPRFAAMVAWGAIWDYHERWQRRIDAAGDVPMSVPLKHIAWALGVGTTDAALRRLDSWRLADVAGEVRMPALVVHGGHDQQVPMSDAQALLGGMSSVDKHLLVYPEGAPGAEHCQLDSPAPAICDIADWLSDRLRRVR
jgi:alpha-beta hydrolase superfamily lysophospholipase